MPALKSTARKLLHAFDLDLVRHSRLTRLEAAARAEADLALLRALPTGQLGEALVALPHSHAQLRQDLFALSQCGFKRGGFFVEFGATDGSTLSNTWLLEKHFAWHGVLAEPGRGWHQRLHAERKAAIDTDCVWSVSGVQLEFLETGEGELSTLAAFAGEDHHATSRRHARKYQVPTVSLQDLLERHAAPCEIDYLSIDTEGSELTILEAFDFSRHRFRAITCEHNFTAKRERIHTLLTGHGYRRVLESLSQFDDWYVS